MPPKVSHAGLVAVSSLVPKTATIGSGFMNENSSLDIQTLLAQAGWMQRIAQALLKDPHAAEDVVQETWLRALRNPPAGAGELRTLRSWLRVVTKRIALRRLESDAARVRREHEVAGSERDMDADAAVERLRLQRSLAGHILELRAPLRTAVLLQYQEGLTPAEVAQRLGISNEAARKRVSRGLSELRVILDREHDGNRGEWSKAFALLVMAPGFLQGKPPVTAASGLAAPVAKLWLLVLVVAVVAPASWLMFRGIGQLPGPNRSEGEASPVAVAEPSSAVDPRQPVRSELVGESPVDAELVVAGRVIDEDGAGVDRAVVHALLPRRSAFDFASVVRAAESSFDIEVLTDREGEFRLVLPRCSVVDLQVKAGRSIAEVADHPSGSRVVITIESPRAIGGVIRDADGLPQANASVRLDRAYASGVHREVAQITTGEDGVFMFSPLPRGRFVLQVRGQDGNYGSRVFELGSVDLLEQDVLFLRARTIRGRVMGDDGQPVEGASVGAARAYIRSTREGAASVSPALIGLGWWGETAIRTDDAGEFSIEVPRGISSTQLLITAAGFSRQQVLLEEESTVLKVVLRRGLGLRGRCLSVAGRPLSGVKVSVVAQSYEGSMLQGDFLTTRTDAMGVFELSNLRLNMRYDVATQRAGLGDVHTVVLPGTGELRDLGDLRLSPAATISGVVTFADGLSRAGVRIVALGRDVPGAATSGRVYPPGLGRRRCITDDRGRFRFLGLDSGDYDIVIPGQPSGSRVSVRVEAGGSRDGVQIELSNFELAGHVTDVRGQPIVQAGIVLVAQKPRMRKLTVTSADGSFRFPSVPVGVYSLRVAPNSIHTRYGNRMVHGVTMTGIHAGERRVHVVLPPAAATRGTAQDAQGEPLPGLLVFARSASHKFVTYESTDDAGEFILRLPPGIEADLYLGPKSRTAVMKKVLAGSQGLRLVQPGPK